MQYYYEPTARPVKKIIAIILAAVLALAALAGGGIFAYYEIRYNDAVALMRQCRYAEAIAAFEALNGYKDSKELIVLCKNPTIELMYKNAIALLDNGKDAEAYALFKRLGNYKDSKIYLSSFKVFYDEVKQYLSDGKVYADKAYIKETDSRGRIVRIYSKEDSSTPLFECEYDERGAMVVRKNAQSFDAPLGVLARLSTNYYDDEGNLIKSEWDTGYESGRTEYEYQDGRLVKEKYDSGTITGYDPMRKYRHYVTHYQYYADGKLARRERQYRLWTEIEEFFYDEESNLLKYTKFTSEYEETTYGDTVETVVYPENTVTYDYSYASDKLIRVSVHDTLGETDYKIDYQYDKNGNVIKMITENKLLEENTKTTVREYEYNYFNILVRERRTRVVKKGDSFKTVVEQTVYDHLGREIYYSSSYSQNEYDRRWSQYDEYGNLITVRQEKAIIKDGMEEPTVSSSIKRYTRTYRDGMEVDYTLTYSSDGENSETIYEYKGATVVFDRKAFEKELQKRDDPASVDVAVDVGIQISYFGPSVFIIPG